MTTLTTLTTTMTSTTTNTSMHQPPIRISGATRLYAILGDPIAQVKSPELFSNLFAASGFDAVMVPVHAPSDKFEAIVPALKTIGNIDGLIFTVPFKNRALPFADRLGDTGGRIEAINALRREHDGTWTGDMFDGKGFVNGARTKGLTIEGRRVALFGAGGAGSAIACELAASGVASIALIDPVHDRARALAVRLRREFPACALRATTAVPDDTNMIINASTVGMKPTDRYPGDLGTIGHDTLFGDVVITETPTPMIRLAMERGCGFVTGRDMIGGQSQAILAFLTHR